MGQNSDEGWEEEEAAADAVYADDLEDFDECLQ